MKEVLKVKIAGTSFALDTEAYDCLADYFKTIETRSGKERAEEIEREFVALVLERQSANTVIEMEFLRQTLDKLGYPEGYTYTPKHHTTTTATTTTTTSSSTSGVGRALIVCAKVLFGIMLAGWFLAAIGILIGFVALVALGEEWTQVVPANGLSPIVFAGLICAVVVLFMGIVGDVGITIIRGKAINFRTLGIAALVWLVFFLSLIFATIRNADNWVEWSYATEARLEAWEEEMEAWEDRIESEWEEAVLNLHDVPEWDSSYTLTFDGFEGAMSFDSFCNRYEEVEPYEDRLEYLLLRGEKVVVKLDNHYEGDRLYRTITITSPDGDTVITSPVRVLTAPQQAQ